MKLPPMGAVAGGAAGALAGNLIAAHFKWGQMDGKRLLLGTACATIGFLMGKRYLA